MSAAQAEEDREIEHFLQEVELCSPYAVELKTQLAKHKDNDPYLSANAAASMLVRGAPSGPLPSGINLHGTATSSSDPPLVLDDPLANSDYELLQITRTMQNLDLEETATDKRIANLRVGDVVVVPQTLIDEDGNVAEGDLFEQAVLAPPQNREILRVDSINEEHGFIELTKEPSASGAGAESRKLVSSCHPIMLQGASSGLSLQFPQEKELSVAAKITKPHEKLRAQDLRLRSGASAIVTDVHELAAFCAEEETARSLANFLAATEDQAPEGFVSDRLRRRKCDAEHAIARDFSITCQPATGADNEALLRTAPHGATEDDAGLDKSPANAAGSSDQSRAHALDTDAAEGQGENAEGQEVVNEYPPATDDELRLFHLLHPGSDERARPSEHDLRRIRADKAKRDLLSWNPTCPADAADLNDQIRVNEKIKQIRDAQTASNLFHQASFAMLSTDSLHAAASGLGLSNAETHQERDVLTAAMAKTHVAQEALARGTTQEELDAKKNVGTAGRAGRTFDADDEAERIIGGARKSMHDSAIAQLYLAYGEDVVRATLSAILTQTVQSVPSETVAVQVSGDATRTVSVLHNADLDHPKTPVRNRASSSCSMSDSPGSDQGSPVAATAPQLTTALPVSFRKSNFRAAVSRIATATTANVSGDVGSSGSLEAKIRGSGGLSSEQSEFKPDHLGRFHLGPASMIDANGDVRSVVPMFKDLRNGDGDKFAVPELHLPRTMGRYAHPAVPTEAAAVHTKRATEQKVLNRPQQIDVRGNPIPQNFGAGGAAQIAVGQSAAEQSATGDQAMADQAETSSNMVSVNLEEDNGNDQPEMVGISVPSFVQIHQEGVCLNALGKDNSRYALSFGECAYCKEVGYHTRPGAPCACFQIGVSKDSADVELVSPGNLLGLPLNMARGKHSTTKIYVRGALISDKQKCMITATTSIKHILESEDRDEMVLSGEGCFFPTQSAAAQATLTDFSTKKSDRDGVPNVRPIGVAAADYVQLDGVKGAMAPAVVALASKNSEMISEGLAKMGRSWIDGSATQNDPNRSVVAHSGSSQSLTERGAVKHFTEVTQGCFFFDIVVSTQDSRLQAAFNLHKEKKKAIDRQVAGQHQPLLGINTPRSQAAQIDPRLGGAIPGVAGASVTSHSSSSQAVAVPVLVDVKSKNITTFNEAATSEMIKAYANKRIVRESMTTFAGRIDENNNLMAHARNRVVSRALLSFLRSGEYAHSHTDGGPVGVAASGAAEGAMQVVTTPLPGMAVVDQHPLLRIMGSVYLGGTGAASLDLRFKCALFKAYGTGARLNGAEVQIQHMDSTLRAFRFPFILPIGGADAKYAQYGDFRSGAWWVVAPERGAKPTPAKPKSLNYELGDQIEQDDKFAAEVYTPFLETVLAGTSPLGHNVVEAVRALVHLMLYHNMGTDDYAKGARVGVRPMIVAADGVFFAVDNPTNVMLAPVITTSLYMADRTRAFLQPSQATPLLSAYANYPQYDAIPGKFYGGNSYSKIRKEIATLLPNVMDWRIDVGAVFNNGNVVNTSRAQSLVGSTGVGAQFYDRFRDMADRKLWNVPDPFMGRHLWPNQKLVLDQVQKFLVAVAVNSNFAVNPDMISTLRFGTQAFTAGNRYSAAQQAIVDEDELSQQPSASQAAGAGGSGGAGGGKPQIIYMKSSKQSGKQGPKGVKGYGKFDGMQQFSDTSKAGKGKSKGHQAKGKHGGGKGFPPQLPPQQQLLADTAWFAQSMNFNNHSSGANTPAHHQTPGHSGRHATQNRQQVGPNPPWKKPRNHAGDGAAPGAHGKTGDRVGGGGRGSSNWHGKSSGGWGHGSWKETKSSGGGAWKDSKAGGGGGWGGQSGYSNQNVNQQQNWWESNPNRSQAMTPNSHAGNGEGGDDMAVEQDQSAVNNWGGENTVNSSDDAGMQPNSGNAEGAISFGNVQLTKPTTPRESAPASSAAVNQASQHNRRDAPPPRMPSPPGSPVRINIPSAGRRRQDDHHNLKRGRSSSREGDDGNRNNGERARLEERIAKKELEWMKLQLKALDESQDAKRPKN